MNKRLLVYVIGAAAALFALSPAIAKGTSVELVLVTANPPYLASVDRHTPTLEAVKLAVELARMAEPLPVAKPGTAAADKALVRMVAYEARGEQIVAPRWRPDIGHRKEGSG